MNLLEGPSVLSPCTPVCCVREGCQRLCLLLYRSCSISRQFFRRNCSRPGGRIDVTVGGPEFKVFLCCHLGSSPRLFTFNVTFHMVWFGSASLLFSVCLVYFFVSPYFFHAAFFWGGAAKQSLLSYFLSDCKSGSTELPRREGTWRGCPRATYKPYDIV